MKAGRELDALIAEKVMGWKVDRIVEHNNTTGDELLHIFGPDKFPHYSTQIADAWLVVEKLGKDDWTYTIVGNSSYNRCDLRKWLSHNNWAHLYSDADTAPLAICLAALKAVGGNDD